LLVVVHTFLHPKNSSLLSCRTKTNSFRFRSRSHSRFRFSCWDIFARMARHCI